MTKRKSASDYYREFSGQEQAEANGRAEGRRRHVTAEDLATARDLGKAGAEIRWLWPGWVQLGVLTALGAPAGVGKTRFCADLLRRMRQGEEWPDGAAAGDLEDAKALWVAADHNHDELVTVAREFGIEDALYFNALKTAPYEGVSLDAREDLDALDAHVKALRPTFVVVDTTGGATSRNTCRQEEARAFYEPLQVIARRYSCAFFANTHLNSAGEFLGRRVLERVRVALRMTKPNPDDPRRRLEVWKSNSKKPEPLGLEMGDACNKYDHNPPEAPAAGEPGEKRGPGRPPTGAVDDCRAWLRERLAHGAAKLHILIDEAQAKGWGKSTVYAAKEGIVEDFHDGRNKWWKLAAEEAF